MQIRAWVLYCAILTPMVGLCADPPPPPPPMDVWLGKGQLGVVDSQGNTESKSANAAIDMTRYDGSWKHAFHLDGLYGQSAGVTAAERWNALWQSNYDINANLFSFGELRYAHDMFSGFQYQASGSAGVGYKLINTEATKLSAQVGVGYRALRPEDLIQNSAGQVVYRVLLPSSNSVVLSAGVDYSQALTSTTTLSNKFLLESGSDDTLLTDALALTVKMSTSLALSLGYSLQDNTKPPAGLKKLDTVETINLVFALKG